MSSSGDTYDSVAMIGIIGTVLVVVVFVSSLLVAAVVAVVVATVAAVVVIVVAAVVVVVVVLVRAVGHVSGAMAQTFLVQHSHIVVDT